MNSRNLWHSRALLSKTGLTLHPTFWLMIPDATFGSESWSRLGSWPTAKVDVHPCRLPCVARGSLGGSLSLNDPGSSIVWVARWPLCALVGTRDVDADPRWRPSDSATCAFVSHAEALLFLVLTWSVRFRAHRRCCGKKKWSEWEITIWGRGLGSPLCAGKSKGQARTLLPTVTCSQIDGKNINMTVIVAHAPPNDSGEQGRASFWSHLRNTGSRCASRQTVGPAHGRKWESGVDKEQIHGELPR